MAFEDRLLRLTTILTDMRSVLVCYSGGVDSAFVLALAHRTLGDRALGMTAVSPSLAPFEKMAAIEIAKQIGAKHELVDSFEIDDPAYQANNPDRCFHCKSELYSISEKKRVEWGFDCVVNGTNIDDLGDYRPGLEAAKNSGVRSPLVEAQFSKDDVRRGASELGLAVWDKPASACLSSRIPFGTHVTRDRLAQIATLEARLLALGFKQVRVRWHPISTSLTDRALARVEVAKNEMAMAFERAEEISLAGKDAGFAYVTLDLLGYRTGSHNEVLSGRSLRIV